MGRDGLPGLLDLINGMGPAITARDRFKGASDLMVQGPGEAGPV